MTNIVVLIKQVPDTWSERKLTDGDFTLDREAADAVLDEINERAVEEALLIKEKEAADGTESTVTVLTAGPERATEAIRKALSMGADKAVHLLDDGMHGSDMVQTGWALARALGHHRGRRAGHRRQRVHRRRRWRGPGHHRRVPGPAAADAPAQGRRSRTARSPASARPTTACSPSRRRLPAIVSVSEKINEPRFPSFKGIMAAKKKEVTTLTLAEIGVEADEVGVANAGIEGDRVDPEAAEDRGREGHRRRRRRHQDRRVPGRAEDHLARPLPQTHENPEAKTMAEVLVLVEHAEGAAEEGHR